MTKRRQDRLSDEELLAQVDWLDKCYAEAAAHDAKNPNANKPNEEADWYDELNRGYEKDRA